MDAIERARQVAARLSAASASSSAPSSSLGKRKAAYEAMPGHKKEMIFVPVNENPDINFKMLLIGPGGDTIRRISEESGCRVRICGRGSSKDGSVGNNPEDQEELHVSIEGSPDGIAIAREQVNHIFSNPDEAMRIKENQLRDLAQRKTIGGAAPGGNEKGYGGASASTYGAGYHHSTSSSDADGGITEVLVVPNGLVGRLIGKGGETIARLQQMSGARMAICRENEMPPGMQGKRNVTLSGNAEAVANLKSRVQDLIDEEIAKIEQRGGLYSGSDAAAALRGQVELTQPFVIKVPVPNDKVGLVIGKRGDTVKGIQDRTGTEIKIPQGADADDGSRRTLSIGAHSKEAADAAIEEIKQVLRIANFNAQREEQENRSRGIITEFYMMPDEKAGLIIGKGGSTIQGIQQRSGARVQIPNHAEPGTNPPMRKCTVTGSEATIAMCKAEMDQVLAGPNPNNPNNFNPYGGGGGYAGYGAGGGNPYSGGGMNIYAHGGSGYVQYAAGAGAGYGQYGQMMTSAPATGPSEVPVVEREIEKGTEEEEEEDITDPEHFYPKYWEYASYYGAKAAREFYGEWSPPEGAAPPEGVIVAPDPDETEDGENGKNKDQEDKDSVAEKEDSVAEKEPNTCDGDEEGDDAEWEAYKASYRTWWLEHGKAQGYPEEPPRPEE